MAFNMFPFTNLHNLNTDWILKTIKELKTATEQAAATVAGYAARLTGLENSTVKYTTEQQLTPEQQATARGNISAAPSVGVVYYNTAQSLSNDYKAQARENIGAAAAGDIPAITGAVRYDEAQSLTTGQKAQARNNIEAMPADTSLPLEVKINYENSAYSMDQEMDDILTTIEVGVPVVITCEEISSWPGFSSYTNLRYVSIAQLRVIRSGTSNDFEIVGDALLDYDDTENKAKILHLSLSISSAVTTIYPTINILEGLPTHLSTDAGKWLKVTSQNTMAWDDLPVYTGGVI